MRQLALVKLPTGLSLEPGAFNADTFLTDTSQHAVTHQTPHVIRWRAGVDESGQPIRQSNARIIRWSNGTLSLQLGKELLAVTEEPLAGASQLFAQVAPNVHMHQGTLGSRLVVAESTAIQELNRLQMMASRLHDAGPLVKYTADVGRADADKATNKLLDQANEALAKSAAALRRRTGGFGTQAAKLSSNFLEDGLDDDATGQPRRDYGDDAEAGRRLASAKAHADDDNGEGELISTRLGQPKAPRPPPRARAAPMEPSEEEGEEDEDNDDDVEGSGDEEEGEEEEGDGSEAEGDDGDEATDEDNSDEEEEEEAPSKKKRKHSSKVCVCFAARFVRYEFYFSCSYYLFNL